MKDQNQLGFAFDDASVVEIARTTLEGLIENARQERQTIEQILEVIEEVSDPPEVIPEEPKEVEAPTHAELERGGQMQLIDVGEWWEEHWKGMPEFDQKDLAPFKTIYVHFENREDMNKFSELVGQKVGLNTKMIWYPEAEIGHFVDKRYIDALDKQEDVDEIDE